jgi:hypothetical protein
LKEKQNIRDKEPFSRKRSRTSRTENLLLKEKQNIRDRKPSLEREAEHQGQKTFS